MQGHRGAAGQRHRCEHLGTLPSFDAFDGRGAFLDGVCDDAQGIVPGVIRLPFPGVI